MLSDLERSSLTPRVVKTTILMHVKISAVINKVTETIFSSDNSFIKIVGNRIIARPIIIQVLSSSGLLSESERFL